MSTPRMWYVLACFAITSTAIAQAPIPVASLITNGDFQNGFTGFTSSYVYRDPVVNQTNTVFDQGTFTVAPNLNSPIAIHPSPGLPDYYDHTTGNASGNFMVINGSTEANKVFWSTTLNVEPNSFYVFSMWLSVWNNSSNNLPQIQVGFNGAVAMIAMPPVPLGTWTNFSTTWYSGSNTTVQIDLQDNVLDFGGNDFGLDDVSFGFSGAAVPEPAAIFLMSAVLFGVGGYKVYQVRKKRLSKSVNLS